MDIVVCTDNNYVMPCGVMINSICKNNQELDINFHIITDESVPPEFQQSIKNVIYSKSLKKVYYYHINGNNLRGLPRLDQTNPKNYITKAAYYPLFLTTLLPSNLNKVLYFDCDLIVRHSLNDLWNTNLGNYSVGVVPDVAEGVIDKYNRLRYQPTKGYFNSGVILINLKKWREESVLNNFLQFIETHPDWIKLHDQDVFNKVFCDDKLILPITYNFQEGFLWNDLFYDYWKYEEQVLMARKDPVIIHYTDSKPWNKGCEHPFREEFFKYQKGTEWENYPPMKKEPLSSLSQKTKNTIKKILKNIGIMAPLPKYPPKYIDIKNL